MSSTTSFTISSKRVLLSSGEPPSPATLKIVDGRVLEIGPYLEVGQKNVAGAEHLDIGELVVMPGIVDAHVHINEPGRTQWEGFEWATKGAAAGGVTTLIDMPLNAIPPTTTVKNLDTKIAAAKGQCRVDVGFLGGVIPGNQEQLLPLVARGVKGFKCFLIESGVEEFPCVNEEQLRKAMATLSGSGTVLMFHAEMEEDPDPKKLEHPVDLRAESYQTFLDSRPQSMELKAISLITRLMKEFPDLRCHIVHLSAADALQIVRETKAAGLKLTVETCFHYLTLAAESIPNGATQFKCCPPIRSQANRELLWEALEDGTIDYVVSDHSPCTPDLKLLEKGDFLQAWGGIASLQFGLSVLWTEARSRNCSLQDVTRWLSENTARQMGLLGRKGQLTVGSDADLVVWDPEAKFTVHKSSIRFRNKLTPYEGKELLGKVHKTFVRGQLVFDASKSADNAAVLGSLLV